MRLAAYRVTWMDVLALLPFEVEVTAVESTQ
jgi:hypothetical protein